MWARNIDGCILLSEDLAEKIKNTCKAGTTYIANGNTYVIGKNMDLERTDIDDRFWFYTEDERHALTLDLLVSHDHFEVGLIERKASWLGIVKEKAVPLTTLTFPNQNLTIL